MTTSSDFFDEWGLIAGKIEDLDDFLSTLRTDVTTLVDGAASAAIPHLGDLSFEVVEAYVEKASQSLITAADTFLVGYAESEMGELESRDVRGALKRLKLQMEADSATIEATTLSVGAASYDAGNTGSGRIHVSIVDVEGTTLENVRPETLRFELVADTQQTGTAGEETWRVRGAATIDQKSRLWPKGSGIALEFDNAHAGKEETSAPGGNVMKNTTFEAFTGHLPDSFDEVIGTAGTTYTETSTALRGAKALRIIGKGSQLTELKQDIGSDTAAKLKPKTKYVLSFWLREGASTRRPARSRSTSRTAAGP